MYESVWNESAHTILTVLEETRERYPQDWQAAHNPQRGDKQQREAFCHRVALRLRDLGIPAGVNGKRGNPLDISEDIITLPRQDTLGAPDTSGRYPSIEIRDIIAGAGPDANGDQAGRLYFGDVTQATLDKNESGCYVTPTYPVTRPPVGGIPPVKPVEPPPPATNIEARFLALETLVRTILSGQGAIMSALSDLDAKILAPGGAFDTQTKRIFGVDGSGDDGVAEETVAKLFEAIEAGDIQTCQVVSYLRRRK